MATRISSCESESNLHHCFRCFVPMRALQFVLESLANRACCLFRAAETRSRIALEGSSDRSLPISQHPIGGTQMWSWIHSSNGPKIRCRYLFPCPGPQRLPLFNS